MRLFSGLLLLATGFRSAPAAPPAPRGTYDPLRRARGDAVETLALVVRDSERERDIPIRVYLPVGSGPAPVVLFSHGLGGTRDTCAYLGRHWAARGYAGVFLQHPGSDDAVWRTAPPSKRLEAMKAAANSRNFLHRIRDVKAVLARVKQWNRTAGHPLTGRLDPERLGMAGHSFGAVTTQAVAGQAFGRRGRNRFTIPEIKAAVILSPGAPPRTEPDKAFGSVRIPWLLITGTRDTSPIGAVGVEARLAVFPALPPGNKFELVLAGAEHAAFTDRRLPGERLPRNPNHHRAVLAFTTAFWDAFLQRMPAARKWLRSDAARAVLDPEDRYRWK